MYFTFKFCLTKISLGIALFLFVPVFVYSQSNLEGTINPGLFQYAPQSPNVGSLIKFGEYEIGYSTGVPNISIPIYTYKGISNGLNLNVSLDYHAGGIKVSEEASNVGIGWSALNAGGVISRNVRGIYDELRNFGFIDQKRLPENDYVGNSPSSIEFRPLSNINASTLDGQCDVFNFSFGGRNGKFVLGKNNDVLLLTKQKLKIEKVISVPISIPGLTDSVITQFTITDELGYKYLFKDMETTLDNGLTGLTAKIYPSSWHLSEIKSPTSDSSIKFTYEDIYIPEHNNVLVFTDAYKEYPLVNTQSPQKWSGSSASSFNIHAKRLKSISFPGGISLGCTYNTQVRQDLETGNSDNSLSKISITDGKNKKGYKLYQDYSLNRLTLLKVNFLEGVAETESMGYSFEYYKNPQSINLPAKNSFAQDHWGYFNGNGGSMIPKEIFPNGLYLGNTVGDGNGHVLPVLEYEIGGGDRDTDPVLSKTGSLKKVIYPTGGFTIFDMEANTATHNWLDKRAEKIVPEHYAPMSIGGYASLGNGTNWGEDDFTFTGTTGVNQITIKVPSVLSATCPSGNCSIHADIKNASGQYIGSGSGAFNPNGSSFTFNCTLTNNTNYNIKIYQYSIENFSPYIGYSWIQDVLMPADTTYYRHLQPYVGGLRVKSISNYDINNKLMSSKSYDYSQINGSSSGALGVFPVYTYPALYAYSESESQGLPESYNPTYKYVFRTSSPIYSAYSNGSPVNYNRVTEIFKTGNDSIGKIVRQFTSFDNSPTNTHMFPFEPIDVNDWEYGLLQEEDIYNKQNKLLKKVSNNFDLKQDDYYVDTSRMENFRSVAIAPVKSYNPGFDGVNLDAQKVYFLMNSFDPSAGYAELTGSKTVEYSGLGDSLITSVAYTYDNDDLYKLSESATNSSLKNQKVNYFYPKEMIVAGNNPSNVYTEMINRNMIGTIVEKKLTTNLQLTKLSTTNYGKINSAFYLPINIDVQNGNSAKETLLKFNRYDVHGNLVEQQKANDVKEVYLWGYRSQYPVAKITGSSYDSAKILINQTILDNALSYTDAQLRTELNKLRTGLKGAMVFTYTYAPLFGLTSETNANGETTYYEYDNQGRLKNSRDKDSKIIKTYSYHYLLDTF